MSDKYQAAPLVSIDLVSIKLSRVLRVRVRHDAGATPVPPPWKSEHKTDTATQPIRTLVAARSLWLSERQAGSQVKPNQAKQPLGVGEINATCHSPYLKSTIHFICSDQLISPSDLFPPRLPLSSLPLHALPPPSFPPYLFVLIILCP